MVTVRTQRPYFITPGCVGCWRFDEGTGTLVRDSSGYRNDGTFSGSGAHWTTGRIGNAGSFNGSSSYVDCGNNASLNLTSAITIEAWIYPHSLDEKGAGHILSQDNVYWARKGYNLKIRNNDEIQFRLGNGSSYYSFTTSTSPISEFNKWYYIVAYYNGTTGKIYVNGNEELTYNYTFTIQYNMSRPLVLGAGFYGDFYPQNYYFNGLIDEVRIHNRIPTINEIKANYNYLRLLKYRTLALRR